MKIYFKKTRIATSMHKIVLLNNIIDSYVNSAAAAAVP